MFAIDSATLDLTEWLCRKFQLLTGRTNVWLAAQLTNLSIVVYFVWVASYFRSLPGVARVLIGLFCIGLLYLLSQTVFRVSIEGSENNAYRRVANGLRNPRRVRDALLRLSFLTLSIVWFYPFLFVYLNFRVPIALLILGYPLIVLTTVVLYVLACDPLPPCAGKVREWLRGAALVRPRAPESIRRSVILLPRIRGRSQTPLERLSIVRSRLCHHSVRWGETRCDERREIAVFRTGESGATAGCRAGVPALPVLQSRDDMRLKAKWSGGVRRHRDANPADLG
jgi:hypothetical protein